MTGGGNFWRGRTSETIDRTKADQIGMLATVMNCIYVSDIFRHVGMKTEVFTPFVCGAFTSLFSKDAAVAAMESGRVIFFAGGTGHPYFLQIQELFCVQSRLKQMRCFWQKPLMEFMTVIRR